jgi:hypothetical protein
MTLTDSDCVVASRKLMHRDSPGTPIGAPIRPRVKATSKNEKGLYDWSTFYVR